MRRRAFLNGIAAAFLLASLAACDKAKTPESRLRALLATAEQAAERKDGAALRGQVSERYADEEGHDKRAIEGVLRYYFLRHESIHLLTRIETIAIPQPGRAHAVVYVAMAGTPLKQPEELSRLAADLHRFELDFVEEAGEWQLTRASWRRAEFADFVAKP